MGEEECQTRESKPAQRLRDDCGAMSGKKVRKRERRGEKEPNRIRRIIQFSPSGSVPRRSECPYRYIPREPIEIYTRVRSGTRWRNTRRRCEAATTQKTQSGKKAPLPLLVILEPGSLFQIVQRRSRSRSITLRLRKAEQSTLSESMSRAAGDRIAPSRKNASYALCR